MCNKRMENQTNGAEGARCTNGLLKFSTPGLLNVPGSVAQQREIEP